jgi:predicted RNA binding protein YcfA (HicA-like mRNA interferase family)
MSKFPQVSGSDLVRALQKVGLTVRRQHGSHIIMRRDDPFAGATLPKEWRFARLV